MLPACSHKKLPVIFQPTPAGWEAGLEKVLAVGRVSPPASSDPANLCLSGSLHVWLWEKPSRSSDSGADATLGSFPQLGSFYI